MSFKELIDKAIARTSCLFLGHVDPTIYGPNHPKKGYCFVCGVKLKKTSTTDGG